MSRTAQIILPFGAEERVFRLGLGELRAIQEKCDAGPGHIAQRLAPMVRGLHAKLSLPDIMSAGMMGDWRVDDVREPILQGLIGGGMSPTEAGVLMRQVFDPRPQDLRHITLAFAILTEGYFMPEDEPAPGEPKAAPKARRSRAARSTSAR